MGRLMSSHNLLSSLLIPIERLRGKVSHCRVICSGNSEGRLATSPSIVSPGKLVCGRFVRIGNHDAVMRIGLRRLQGGGPILQRRCEGPCADAGTHHLGSSSAVRRRRQTSAETACDCYLLDLAHYGVGRRTTPSSTSPVVRNRHSAMAVCGRAPRSWSCAFCPRRRSLDTTVPERCPSGGIESARRAGSCRDAPARCPSWRDPSPAVANHSRRVSR